MENKERTQKSALEIDPDAIGSFAGRLHYEHTPPKEPEEKFPGPGQWVAARQFAIFEILAQLRENALPVLRRIACGKYGWTQDNTIEVLCRLAAQDMNIKAVLNQLLTVPEFLESCDQLLSQRSVAWRSKNTDAPDSPPAKALLAEVTVAAKSELMTPRHTNMIKEIANYWI